ncbi:MAG: hypothetical protein ABSG64_12985 [Solirubrobacteraceae bacterium]|jgi:hypothetical protein
MADTLSALRSDLEKRLRELEPLIEEHAQVRKALEALKGVGPRLHQASPATPRTSASSGGGRVTRRRGRPRGSGGRANQVLRLVREQPGITISELAQRMKIKPNYLYRIVPGMAKDGKLDKRGSGYHPPGS